MILRTRLSLIYASIWGFGGVFHGTSRRAFFETIALKAFDVHVAEINELLPDGCIDKEFSMFHMFIDLRGGCFVHASGSFSSVTGDNMLDQDSGSISSKQIDISNLPRQLSGCHVEMEFNKMLAKETGVHTHQLICRTPAQRSLHEVLFRILRSGGNAMLVGPRSCGKTFLIKSLLHDLQRQLASPETAEASIIKNLSRLMHGSDKMCSGRNDLQTVQEKVSSKEVVNPIHEKGSIPQLYHSFRTMLSYIQQLPKEYDDDNSFAVCWKNTIMKTAMEVRNMFVFHL